MPSSFLSHQRPWFLFLLFQAGYRGRAQENLTLLTPVRLVGTHRKESQCCQPLSREKTPFGTEMQEEASWRYPFLHFQGSCSLQREDRLSCVLSVVGGTGGWCHQPTVCTHLRHGTTFRHTPRTCVQSLQNPAWEVALCLHKGGKGGVPSQGTSRPKPGVPQMENFLVEEPHGTLCISWELRKRAQRLHVLLGWAAQRGAATGASAHTGRKQVHLPNLECTSHTHRGHVAAPACSPHTALPCQTPRREV